MNARWMLGIAAAAIAGGAQPAAAAEAFPVKPIRMVVGFNAGGAPDILARLLGDRLRENMGQQVVVDNRAGATGNIGAALVADANPDGYTLFMATVSVAIGPTVYKSLPFAVPTSFSPVSMVASVPLILVVNPTLPVNSVSDLIKVAKAKPGSLNYATPGYGSPQHLTAESFKLKVGVNMVHIPYKGGGQANAALLAGESHLFFSGMPPALPHVRAGRLRALAVTTARRSPSAPDVPTMGEAGLPGFEADNWHAILAPAGTPPAVVKRLADAIAVALADPALAARFVTQGAEAKSSTPRELTAFMRAEVAKWAGVAKAAGVKAQ